MKKKQDKVSYFNSRERLERKIVLNEKEARILADMFKDEKPYKPTHKIEIDKE